MKKIVKNRKLQEDIINVFMNELGYKKSDALVLKANLYSDIDRITKNLRAHTFSIEEKDKLILAIIRIAKRFAKETLEQLEQV